MIRHCFALDLKDDPLLIAEYEAYHKNVWPEIQKSFGDSGIEKMEIYRAGCRLFMVMEVNEQFSLERKSNADVANLHVQKWEDLMWKYQQALPHARQGEKWMLMNKIFDFIAGPL